MKDKRNTEMALHSCRFANIPQLAQKSCLGPHAGSHSCFDDLFFSKIPPIVITRSSPLAHHLLADHYVKTPVNTP